MLWRRAHRQQEELRTRASRQEALATLGQQALAGAELDGLLMDGAAIVARELGVDHVAVLELTRDSKRMLARAGAGLPDGVLGGVLPTDPSRLARDLGSASAISPPCSPTSLAACDSRRRSSISPRSASRDSRACRK